jgi:hypothetical protein
MDRLKFFLQIKTWKLFCVFITLLLFGVNNIFGSYITFVTILVWLCWVVSIAYNGLDLLNGLSISWLTKKGLQWRAIIFFLGFINCCSFSVNK